MTQSKPEPEVNALTTPYWDGLASGELRYQRCGECSNAWLPPREHCPSCLSSNWAWTAASGRGRLISWVVYRQSMHPAFADEIPYNVAIVELDEGPRLITNILADEADLAIEFPVELRISGAAPPLARFVLASPGDD
jgi:uncharacterized OB-fold protein